MDHINSTQNILKAKLKSGKQVFGTWSMIPNATVMNILSSANLDFVISDLEHGAISLETLENLIYANEATNSSLVVRIPKLNQESILRVLEVGTRSIIMSHVDSTELAKFLVSAVTYPPLGTRGLSPFTKNHIYSDKNITQKMENLNQQMLVGVLIEGKAGMEKIEKIAEVPGIDLMYLGIYDLAAQYGYLKDLENPEFLKIIEKFAVKIHKTGKKIGTVATNHSQIGYLKGIGFDFIAFRNDAALIMDSALHAKKIFEEA